MVKIRLRRIGTKGRPYYRVVVAHSTSARNGKFVEAIGTYDPVVKPTHIEVDQERALHWLRTGAQPTETTAYLLSKIGVLEQYFQERPNARESFGFLDKRTAASSVASVMDQAPAKGSAKAEPIETAAPVKAAAEAPSEPAAEVPKQPTAEEQAEPETQQEAIAEPEAESAPEISAETTESTE